MLELPSRLEKLTYNRKNVWYFIEEWFPDYYGSEDIAYNNDLFTLLEGEGEEGSSAKKLLDKEYGGDYDNPHIEIDFRISCEKIMGMAIENYQDNSPLD